MVTQNSSFESKVSKVGVIPQDWDSSTLDELGFFKNGINKSKDYFGHGFPFVNLLDVFGKSEIATVDNLGLINSDESEQRMYDLKKGDVIFVRSSVKPVGVGLTILVSKTLPKTVFSGFLIRFRPNLVLSTSFKKYCFSSKPFRSSLISLSTVSANTNINQNALKRLVLIYPRSLREQSAIAKALSDIDSLTESLDKLIEKKKNIKRGATQELLTGKKRLPGFSEDWEIIQLKNIASQFIVPMRNKPKLFKGNIPWCRIEDFVGKYLSDSKFGQYVNKEIIKIMNLKVCPKNTLLVSCSADLGRCAIVKRPLVTNQTFIGLVFNDVKASEEFLYYYMTFHSVELNNLSSGTTISYLSREQFETFKVNSPKSKEEQSVIAYVLSSMDLEIEGLEQKREKYKQLKIGMMQQLLTGEIRLKWNS